MRSLALAGIVFLVIGLVLLFYGLNAGYMCPLQLYQNGKLVGGGGCGSVPLIIPAIGIAFVIIGAILLALSVKTSSRNKSITTTTTHPDRGNTANLWFSNSKFL
jgi:uncharacterized membrane protein